MGFPSSRKSIFHPAWIMGVLALGFLVGCQYLFGWEIHAPGILSENFSRQVSPVSERVALYLPRELLEFKASDPGSRFADPKDFYVGESLGPMLVEAFQQTFGEFVFMEVEPTPAILKRYGIPYLVAVQIKKFDNELPWKGQTITLVTETVVFNADLKELARYESRGSSEARKVFAKKGGPEVNLNAAVESNVLANVQYLQEALQRKVWQGEKEG